MYKTKSIFLVLVFISVWSVFSLYLTGCNLNKMKKISDSVIVKIPWKEKGDVQYRIQNIELKTLKQISPLKGDAANLFVDPEIFADHIGGSPFEVKFTYTAKNEIVPLDRVSIEALTLYAHMERLYLWSNSLNLPLNLKSKLDVGLAAEFMDGGLPMHNNALFSNPLNAMLVVPYTNKEVPLSLNGGVLAHEYFHYLFNGLVLNFLAEQNHTGSHLYISHFYQDQIAFSTAIENQIVDQTEKLNEWVSFAFIRGMNEGLADVWGWLYSEDTNFIVASLSGVEKMRDLETTPRVLWTLKQMRNSIMTKVRMGETAEAVAYELGTQYARWIYTRITEVEGTTHLSEVQRNLWSNRIIERLVTYAHQYMGAKDFEKVLPSGFIIFLLFGEEKLSDKECARWSAFVAKGERREVFSKNCQVGALYEF